jgi:enterochelin esterase-like enzyme
MRRTSPWLFLASFVLPADLAAPPPEQPTARALIDRRARERAPVWVDGNTATFFYRGEAEQVKVFFVGEEIPLRRLPDSDVWTATVSKPDMAKGVFTYAIRAGKKDQPVQGKELTFQRWRGPQAPPPVARAKELKGEVRTLDFESQALGAKRKVRVYLPPGHDRTKTCPVIYATDGNDGARVLEPLILAGKVPPLVTVATSSGNYLGDRQAGYDVQKDLRALEYLSGFNAERYAAHEKFFCEELPAWAERTFGASKERKSRAVFGCSNGARFAVDMGATHPELFGHVFAFSVAGRRPVRLADKPTGPPHFHLAAGTWEPFLKITTETADELKKRSVGVTFITRVAGHDMTMWEEELAGAAVRAFGPGPPPPAADTRTLEAAARGEFAEAAGTFDAPLVAALRGRGAAANCPLGPKAPGFCRFPWSKLILPAGGRMMPTPDREAREHVCGHRAGTGSGSSA